MNHQAGVFVAITEIVTNPGEWVITHCTVFNFQKYFLPYADKTFTL